MLVDQSTIAVVVLFVLALGGYGLRQLRNHYVTKPLAELSQRLLQLESLLAQVNVHLTGLVADENYLSLVAKRERWSKKTKSDMLRTAHLYRSVQATIIDVRSTCFPFWPETWARQDLCTALKKADEAEQLLKCTDVFLLISRVSLN